MAPPTNTRRPDCSSSRGNAPSTAEDGCLIHTSLLLPCAKRGAVRGNSSNRASLTCIPLLPPAGEGGRRPDEGVLSASVEPQTWAVLKLRLVVFLKRCHQLNQHPHPPCRAPSPAGGRRGKSRGNSESHFRRRVSNPVFRAISQTSRNFPRTALRFAEEGEVNLIAPFRAAEGDELSENTLTGFPQDAMKRACAINASPRHHHSSSP